MRFADLEAERLAALHALDIIETGPEPRFDRITAFAADLFDVPISLISLVSFIAVSFVKKSDQGKDLHVAEVHEEYVRSHPGESVAPVAGEPETGTDAARH